MIAQIKHYITNDFENGRNSTSVKIDEQTLHESELPAFEAGVKAGAGSAMCSYNRINDVYGCGNELDAQQVLKGELGFMGFVTSDWGATHRTTDLIHGLDMEQSGSGNLGNPVINAAANGTPTSLLVAANIGDTAIKLASLDNVSAGQTAVIDTGANKESDVVDFHGLCLVTPGRLGFARLDHSRRQPRRPARR